MLRKIAGMLLVSAVQLLEIAAVMVSRVESMTC